MKKINFWLVGLLLIIGSAIAFSATPRNKHSVVMEQSILKHYLAEPESIEQPWVLKDTQYDSTHKVSIFSYTLTSQFWPKPNMSSHGIFWKHTLTIYQPENVKTTQALLFVNQGTRYKHMQGSHLSSSQPDFARIAEETQSIVIDLQDVPNQYLVFEDNIPRKEDSIVAYTWNRFMDNPDIGGYWPIHLPMTKAVIKAMDATQQIIALKGIEINKFVVSGASKRGLATWLAALADERINAIIPIVIDILDTKKNLNLIYTSYDNNWPPAFHDYIDEKIPERIDTIEFSKLMNIEDPLAYITCEDCDSYKKRLSIPKYIISASGDDFFVPDSLNLYLNQLPGETTVKVMPNQSHYVDIKIVTDLIIPYYQSIIDGTQRPVLKWEIDQAGKLKSIVTNKKPLSVTLWEAENPIMRDFRLAAKITYSSKALEGTCSNGNCHYAVKTNAPKKGWKAHFVEVTFMGDHNKPFVVTTSTYVIPSALSTVSQ